MAELKGLIYCPESDREFLESFGIMTLDYDQEEQAFNCTATTESLHTFAQATMPLARHSYGYEFPSQNKEEA